MAEPSPMSPQQRKMLLGYGAAGLAAVAVIWWVMRKRAAPAQPDMGGFSPADTGMASGYQPSLFGYTDPTTGQFISGVGATGVGSVFGPSTNAAWAQQAEAYLISLGYDAVATGAALGKYLTGQTMTSDQASTVQAALGFLGAPPIAVPPVSTTTPPGQTNPPASFWPPIHTTGPSLGQAGNYWWTPANEEQAANFALASIPGANPGNESSYRARIMQLNPQIDWSQDFRSLVGAAIYIPAVTIGGYGTAHTEQPWPIPTGASLDAPATYHPK